MEVRDLVRAYNKNSAFPRILTCVLKSSFDVEEAFLYGIMGRSDVVKQHF